ncbi:hypothetical protein L6V77_32365 [Myxococcota bacterium]|nr:hypothetical protein [Myxococcota bacterium]
MKTRLFATALAATLAGFATAAAAEKSALPMRPLASPALAPSAGDPLLTVAPVPASPAPVDLRGLASLTAVSEKGPPPSLPIPGARLPSIEAGGGADGGVRLTLRADALAVPVPPRVAPGASTEGAGGLVVSLCW